LAPILAQAWAKEQPRRAGHDFAAATLCRGLTLSAIALSLLHPAAFDPEPMLAPIAPADDSAQQTPIRGRLMSPAELHADSIVIDGLIIAKWNRELFEDMRKGGLTAANCTVSVWEGFQATINNIVASQTLIRDNSDLVIPVKTTADIRRAKEQGKTGIIFGFQNAHAFEDQLGYIEIFKQLGVGVVQMCYNTQNLVGTGCYERDGGLSGFGREVVAEMNRVGIMCDLSHVGSKTSEEVILESKKPVCYSHCLPSGLKEHPRNKSDAELKFIADHGGFVGVTMFAPFLAKGIDSTIDDYAEAIEYTMNIVGEDSIGIGTDFTQGHGQDFFEMLTHDKGYARRLTSFGKIINPLGIRTVGEFPNLTETLLKRGHNERVVRKIMGENWVNVLKDVWGE
jgi:membrane dipeptidase